MTHVNEAKFQDGAMEANFQRAIELQPDGTFGGGVVSAVIADVPIGSRLCRITHYTLPAEVSLTSLSLVGL